MLFFVKLTFLFHILIPRARFSKDSVPIQILLVTNVWPKWLRCVENTQYYVEFVFAVGISEDCERFSGRFSHAAVMRTRNVFKLLKLQDFCVIWETLSGYTIVLKMFVFITAIQYGAFCEMFLSNIFFWNQK